MATRSSHRWPEKASTNEKKKNLKLMKCMNSNPSESRWIEFYEGQNVCEEWVEVDVRATATLCPSCTKLTIQ